MTANRNPDSVVRPAAFRSKYIEGLPSGSIPRNAPSADTRNVTVRWPWRATVVDWPSPRSDLIRLRRSTQPAGSVGDRGRSRPFRMVAELDGVGAAPRNKSFANCVRKLSDSLSGPLRALFSLHFFMFPHSYRSVSSPTNDHGFVRMCVNTQDDPFVTLQFLQQGLGANIPEEDGAIFAATHNESEWILLRTVNAKSPTNAELFVDVPLVGLDCTTVDVVPEANA
jgi:hypothetical protein